MEEFHCAVIGSGSAGNTAALALARAGKRVAIVDKVPYGGTCALRGCDPKRVLVGVADALENARRLQGRGLSGDLRIEWSALMAFKESFTEPVPHEREKTLKEAGVTTLHGTARFTGRNTFEVDGDELRFEQAVIATGAVPMRMPFAGAEHLVDNDAFLRLQSLPKRIVFVGGGFISLEFAHVARAAGADVHVVEQGPVPLAAFDRDLVGVLVEQLARAGIAIDCGTAVSDVRKNEECFVVTVEHGGRKRLLECDLVVHGAGRVPDLAALQLDRANVPFEKTGITVNEYLQSTGNSGVYAAGDCVRVEGSAPLTPVSALEGEIVAKNILEGNVHKPDFRGLASIVYTNPALAMAGLTEEQARKEQIPFTVHAGDATGWYSARRVNAPAARYKVLAGADGRILGAHLLGPNVEELINVVSLAMRAAVPVERLKETLFAWPTASADLESMVE